MWRVGDDDDDGDDKDGADDDDAGEGGRHPRGNRPLCQLRTAAVGRSRQHPPAARAAAFSPHGGQLVAARDDATVWLWDAAGG